jgi:Flp pilus assembly protein TadB
MIFGKKKKEEEARKKALEERRKEIGKALRVTEIRLPEKARFVPYPREYLRFLEELRKKPSTWYEKACSFAGKIIPIKLPVKTRIKIEESLRTSYINATPKGVFSLASLLTILVLFFVIIGIFLGIGMVFLLIGLMFSGGVFWYFYNYPASQARAMSVKMSADTVLAILYMVIYMRISPNIEGAVKFASQNLEGPLAWDLRKLLWDIEVGVYPSADSALMNYSFRWKEKNEEFAEALNMLRGSLVESGRREIVYEEIINAILDGTRERTKHYAASLRMPITLVHAMGILLPIMGLVLFPIVLIFIADVVKPSFIFFGYNILLPVILYFIVDHVLKVKPPTFSQPDISKAKGIPPLGKFSIKGAFIPIWPIAILLALPLILFGLFGITGPDVYLSVNFSLLITLGFALVVIVYTFLDSYQKIKIRKDIEKIENEFSTALFQFGNTLSGGIPIEVAIEKARENLKNLKIGEMFNIVSLNMRKFGYTFEDALFDKNIGAIWYYPSKLIHSIMQTIVQSSKKSVRVAANSMVVISRYLKGIHDVKEEINDMLGEVTSSMRFLAMFLAPLVSGVTVTMAVVIIQILTRIGEAIGGLTATASSMSVAQTFLFVPWALGGEPPVTPSMFQLIVGIYMIEVAVLLSVFLNGIEYGEDVIGVRDNIWKILVFGVVIYLISWIVTYTMFGGALETILTPVQT